MASHVKLNQLSLYSASEDQTSFPSLLVNDDVELSMQITKKYIIQKNNFMHKKFLKYKYTLVQNYKCNTSEKIITNIY